LLGGLPGFADPRLIVGYETGDDAAVYEIDSERSIISTVDFFSPMVDDPRTFGRIAAANAMSDVWAMRGRVLFALNLLCFPEATDTGIAGEILAGGAEKLAEAGAVLGGGHSIYDHEPKYGLAVTGIAETKRILRNNTPAIGHKVILTKPLGVGIIMAANREEAASPDAARGAVSTMERLNKRASERADGFGVSACTDVTGFGLLVHALEMVPGGACMRIFPDSLPVLPEAAQYADEGMLTAGGRRNRNFVGENVDLTVLPFATQEILCDPQTSGGLLMAVDSGEADALLGSIREDYPMAAIIGEISGRIGRPIEFA
jgi:selenide,water dikinase